MTAQRPVADRPDRAAIFGGLGGLVTEIISARAPRRVERIGIDDTWGESAPGAWLLDRHGLTPERIAARVRRVLATD